MTLLPFTAVELVYLESRTDKLLTLNITFAMWIKFLSDLKI